MSVVLDKPIVTQLPRSVEAPVVFRPKTPVEPAWRPVDVPVAAPTAPVRVRRKSRVSVAQLVLAKSMLFGGVFVATFVVSSLAGHCLSEKSRVQNNAAMKREHDAVRAERGTAERLHFVQDASSVERWAFRNRFHPADGLGETSTPQNLVAANR